VWRAVYITICSSFSSGPISAWVPGAKASGRLYCILPNEAGHSDGLHDPELRPVVVACHLTRARLTTSSTSSPFSSRQRAICVTWPLQQQGMANNAIGAEVDLHRASDCSAVRRKGQVRSCPALDISRISRESLTATWMGKGDSAGVKRLIACAES
jgi:hypothetical protein